MRSPLSRFYPPVVAVLLALSGCRTEELPNLTRDRLFITISAAPATLGIRAPGENRASSQVTALLRNEEGVGLAGETLLFRITDENGREIAVGTLSAGQAVTDSAGSAKVVYSAPNSNEQPSNRQIFVSVLLINPSYAFEVSGSQAIKLELSGAQCSIDAVPDNPAVGSSVNFTATVPNAGTLVSFEWKFGDTTSATTTTNTASHQYTLQGAFTVDLTATNTIANKFTCKTTVDVGGSTPGAPKCGFTSKPNPSCVNQTVNFNGTGSDPDGGPVTFSWSFGSTLEDTATAFGSDGTKTVTLTVTDDENQTCKATGKQIVLGAPTISGFNPSGGIAGATITINGTNFISGKTLTIGGAAVASYSVNSNGTQITATVPAGTDGNPITFNNGCGQVTSAGSFDFCGALSISGSPSGTEGTGLDFTVATDQTCSVAQSAVFSTSGCGTDAADAADFGGSFPGGTVTVDPSSLNKTLTIQTSQDTTDEPASECFRVTLSSPTNATVGSPSTADGSILDDDP